MVVRSGTYIYKYREYPILHQEYYQTNREMKYYQLSFTLDKTIRGRYEMPHTISIESKDFLKYISEKNRTVSMYFENRNNLYEDMPDNLSGKLLERNGVIDFMDFTPSCLSLIAVVSNNMKRIFEQLKISKGEYVFKSISIKGYAEKFYLLFVPIIPDTEFIYPECVFADMFGDETKVFNNRAEYYNDPNDYCPKKVTLGDRYKGYDLLYPQGGGFFFSERIIEAMKQENIIGYDVIEGGCFYEEIEF